MCFLGGFGRSMKCCKWLFLLFVNLDLFVVVVVGVGDLFDVIEFLCFGVEGFEGGGEVLLGVLVLGVGLLLVDVV